MAGQTSLRFHGPEKGIAGHPDRSTMELYERGQSLSPASSSELQQLLPPQEA